MEGDSEPPATSGRRIPITRRRLLSVGVASAVAGDLGASGESAAESSAVVDAERTAGEWTYDRRWGSSTVVADVRAAERVPVTALVAPRPRWHRRAPESDRRAASADDGRVRVRCRALGSVQRLGIEVRFDRPTAFRLAVFETVGAVRDPGEAPVGATYSK